MLAQAELPASSVPSIAASTTPPANRLPRVRRANSGGS
jgi:hypothetical protein